mgnify:CR=1 FL=1
MLYVWQGPKYHYIAFKCMILKPDIFDGHSHQYSNICAEDFQSEGKYCNYQNVIYVNALFREITLYLRNIIW